MTRSKYDVRQYQVHKGYLIEGGPTHDGPRAPRDDYEQDPDEDDTLEIHNYIPVSEERTIATRAEERFQDRANARAEERDRAGAENGGYHRRRRNRDEEPDEEQEGHGEVVARFPADQYHFATEGDEVVIYRGAGTPAHKSDIYDFNARDSRSRPPRTLAELNRSNAAHYRQKEGPR